MVAVFPVIVAVSGKGGTAGRAGVRIDGFPIDEIHVAVPPAVPAGVRAELFLFPALGLDDRFAAVWTKTVR